MGYFLGKDVSIELKEMDKEDLRKKVKTFL
jgi:hypothetical protein